MKISLMKARNRIVFYLFLALFCYTLATIFAATISVILFVGLAGIAELLFWLNLFHIEQRSADPEKTS